MLNDIVTFLDDFLEVARVSEKYATNGLQVEGPQQVERVGFCVDACQETFRMLDDCQLVIVHHGLFWPSVTRLTGPLYRNLYTLFENKCGLYACHLPLDVHPQVGNNARLIELLGMVRSELFAPVGYLADCPPSTKERPHGQQAWLPDAWSPQSLLALVEERIGPARLLDFGDQVVRRVAVSSGQASPAMVAQALAQNAQVLLTGEANHPLFHAAREAGLGVILAGHYATETWGVKALMPILAREFSVTTRFVDVPTGF